MVTSLPKAAVHTRVKPPSLEGAHQSEGTGQVTEQLSLLRPPMATAASFYREQSEGQAQVNGTALLEPAGSQGGGWRLC